MDRRRITVKIIRGFRVGLGSLPSSRQPLRQKTTHLSRMLKKTHTHKKNKTKPVQTDSENAYPISRVCVQKHLFERNPDPLGTVVIRSWYEPQREKTWYVLPAKTRIILCTCAVWAVSVSRMKKLHPWLSKMRPAKIQISLRADWSESSLDGHVRRYVFWRLGSYYYYIFFIIIHHQNFKYSKLHQSSYTSNLQRGMV